MRAAIRFGACLLMATSSAAAFAADDQASPGVYRDETQSTTNATPNDTMDDTTDDSARYLEEAGGGSRQPNDADTHARPDPRSDASGIDEYSETKFLEQTWMAAP